MRLHANVWSYGATWPGNTPASRAAGPWHEIRQSFVATGSSVTEVDLRSSLSGITWTASIHDPALPGDPQVGTSKSFNSVSGPSDVRLFWCGGDIVTVPGHTYYLKLHVTSAFPFDKGVFCENEPIPDMSDSSPNGCIYYDGVADQSRDIGATICSDDDGIVTSLYIDKGGAYPALVSSVGQTFTARGTSLLCFQFWGLDKSSDYVATLYNGIDGFGIPGAKIPLTGGSRMQAYTRSGDPEVIFTWEPGECPLTTGNTYYIEVTRPGYTQFQFSGSGSNLYSGGDCWVSRTLVTNWDMSGIIMEQESAFSAARATVPIPIEPTSPGVAFADRGARSLTVRWTTPDVASDSTVEYGAWNANYTNTYYSSALVTSHVATLTGLQPNTMYHFRVKSAASLYKTAVSRDIVACTINETPNLLVNPSFEIVQTSPPDHPHHRVIAAPWHFTLGAEAADGGYFNSVPPYDGSWFACPAVNGSLASGCAYQNVPAIPGVQYNFTTALYTVMKENNTEKYDCWHKEARLDYVKIGIDPTGGIDPLSTNVQWTPTMYSQQHWTTIGTQAVAASNGNITVFVNMYGVGGEWHIYGIDDCRLSGNYPEATPIADLKGTTPDGLRSTGDLIITATPAQVGAYYAETEDRTQGIKIQSTQTVALGSRVAVTGALTTDSNTHERYFANAGFTSSASDTAPDSLCMKPRNVGGAAFGTLILAVDGSLGPHNTGLLITVAGKITDKAVGSYIYVNDGSLPGLGIKIDTSRLAAGDVPAMDDVVSVRGISTLWLDGSTVKPLVCPRNADDISDPYD